MKKVFFAFGTVAFLVSIAFSAQAAEEPKLTPEDSDKIQSMPEPTTQQLAAPTTALGVQTGNAQTAVACTQCFTCGGDWPIFQGVFAVPPGPNNVTERGPGCSGVPGTQTTDTRPFLCCR